MQINYSLSGSRVSAVTPCTILFGAYSNTVVYNSVASVGVLPLSPEAAAALADVQSLTTSGEFKARIAAIDVAIANLTLFERQTRAYYDARVSRTSGGKRDRLRAERADLCNQALDELALLRSARASAVRLTTAVVTAKQDDYDPNTGKALTPAEKKAIADQTALSPDMSALIIPVGAALAALFFLKGH